MLPITCSCDATSGAIRVSYLLERAASVTGKGGVLQGVPLRVELGMKDVEKQSVVSARRDTGAKETIAFSDVASRVPSLLEQIQV